MADIVPRGNLSLYLDDIMNEYFDTQQMQSDPGNFEQRFQGASPEEMLRQEFIDDLLRRGDPIVYEELPLEERSRNIRSAHRV
jgi:hypothetical protein